jgi:hypothetical protein
MKNPIEVVVLVEWQDEQLAQDLAKLLGERQVKSKLGAVASELRARAAFLRSRPMGGSPGLQRAEREVLAELEALEIQARMLEVERKLGKPSPMYLGELKRLDERLFAARRRYEGLLETMDEHWAMRSKPPNPERRAEELEEIERFLAAKKAKLTGTDGK